MQSCAIMHSWLKYTTIVNSFFYNYFQLGYRCVFRPAICMLKSLSCIPLHKAVIPKQLVSAQIIFLFYSEWRMKSNKVLEMEKRGRVLVASQNLMCVFNMHLVAIFILILSKEGFKTETPHYKSGNGWTYFFD